MQSLIESYGIPFDTFQKLTVFSDSIVSGSAALMLYLKQEGIEAGFEANDIDIYVRQAFDINAFVSLLGESNYVPTEVKHSYPVNKYDQLRGIGQVITLTKESSLQKIQLIHVLGVDRILPWMFEEFDLSCCASWWSPAADRFHTLHPEFTKERKMFHISQKARHDYISYQSKLCYHFPGIKDMHSRYKAYYERVLKYTSRGFTMMKEAPVELGYVHYNMMYDLYMDRSARLEGQKAFDVWAYEEVGCGEFLEQSKDHLLVYVGTQYYAFHRDSLCAYMREHRHTVKQQGKVYSTPYHQSVTAEAMTYFEKYQDPIIELVPAFTVQSSEWQPRDISMFTARFYTVEQWSREAPWNTVTPVKQQ